MTKHRTMLTERKEEYDMEVVHDHRFIFLYTP